MDVQCDSDWELMWAFFWNIIWLSYIQCTAVWFIFDVCVSLMCKSLRLSLTINQVWTHTVLSLLFSSSFLFPDYFYFWKQHVESQWCCKEMYKAPMDLFMHRAIICTSLLCAPQRCQTPGAELNVCQVPVMGFVDATVCYAISYLYPPIVDIKVIQTQGGPLLLP